MPKHKNLQCRCFMHKKIIICIVVLVASATAFGQKSYEDSLKQAIKQAKSDTGSANTLLVLADFYAYRGKNVAAIQRLTQALPIYHRRKLYEKESEVLITLIRNNFSLPGDLFVKASRKDTINNLIGLSLILSRQHQLHGCEALALSYQGYGLYRGWHNADSAKLLMAKALEIFRRFPNDVMEAKVLLVECLLLRDLNELPSAINVAKRALALGKRAGDPATEVKALAALSTTYLRQNQRDSVIAYGLTGLKTALEANIVPEILAGYKKFINAHFLLLKDSLHTFYQKAMLLNRQYGDIIDSLGLMADYAEATRFLGNYPRAMRTLNEVLAAEKAAGDSTVVANTFSQLGELYEGINDFNGVADCAREAIGYSSHSPFDRIYGKVRASLAYAFLNNKDSALYFGQQALADAKANKNLFGGFFNTLGRAYCQIGQDSLALQYLRYSYYYFTKVGADFPNLQESCYGLAIYFNKKKQFDSAFWYARQSADIGLENAYSDFTYETCVMLAGYFTQKHMADSALYYQQAGDKVYASLFNPDNVNDFVKMGQEEDQRLQQLASDKKIAAEQYKSKLVIYGLIAALLCAVVIGAIVAQSNRQRKKAYALLQKQQQETNVQKSTAEQALRELQATQKQLVQSEKMASLGELTAGIAHEIQNPLNFVNNFSEVSVELAEELADEIEKAALPPETKGAIGDIVADLVQNQQKINFHGKRADGIVKSMLQHSRASTGQKEPADLNQLADEYLRLSYHGLRAKDKSFNATLETSFDNTLPNVAIVPQDVGRVLVNMFTNAFYSVAKKQKLAGAGYKPTVTLTTVKNEGFAEIRIRDNGLGIPKTAVDKIFNPFFTTKPTGEGTGLGLSLSYEIITQGHGGSVKVETVEGEYAEFVFQIPL